MTPSLQNMSFLSLSTASPYPFFALMCRFDAHLHLCSVGEMHTCIYALLGSSPLTHPRVRSMNDCCWCCCCGFIKYLTDPLERLKKKKKKTAHDQKLETGNF